ncbi:hypothetical protein AV530_004469 [Patagioenas fasciata monilis]|uniref:Uncharacterized protein n=1 Tax=Patagioenas fasciata monilis TaxID=372326 RepID=A0A1V4JCK0_PATFA|nr:hypothetical protein AV530_004469 [Patagioenas fasciata monilis]
MRAMCCAKDFQAVNRRPCCVIGAQAEPGKRVRGELEDEQGGGARAEAAAPIQVLAHHKVTAQLGGCWFLTP